MNGLQENCTQALFSENSYSPPIFSFAGHLQGFISKGKGFGESF